MSAAVVTIRGLDISGIPWAARVPASSPQAERLARHANHSRSRRADLRRLSAILDVPAHAAELAEIVDRLNALARKRLNARQYERNRHAV